MKERRQTPEVIALVALFLGITVLTVAGFALEDWLPPAASEHGAGVDGVIRYLLMTTGAGLVVGTVVMVGFVWRYGRGRATGPPRTSPRVEDWWSLVPPRGVSGRASGAEGRDRME